MPANDKQWKAYELVFDAIMALSDDKQCYQLSDKTVAMLLSQTGYFHWFTRWNKVGGLSSDDKAAIIELAGNAESELLNGGICDAPVPDESDCFDYPPDSPFLLYAPQDPYSQPDTIPTGYLLPPFYHNPLVPLPGVLPNDAMVNFASIPVFASLPDLLESGFPRIRINLSGAGKVTITFVTIVQGGVALITPDGVLADAKLVDLNYFSFFDSSAFEDLFDTVVGGVTDNTVIHEQEITGVGTHYIDITFLPSVSATELVGFGGGLRNIELCGFTELGDYPMPEFQIASCILQWRPNSSASWTDLGNVCGADGSDGSNGSNGLTPLITVDDTEAHHHKVLLALSDAPIDTVQIADILDGLDGECPDCPPLHADLCRFAKATVSGMWLSVSGLLTDLQGYKDANPSATYLDASDAIYAGDDFGMRSQAALTDFIQSIYEGDGIETFSTTTAAILDEISCCLFNQLTDDYINDVIIGQWQDCLSSLVTDAVSFMLLIPTLTQFRLWEAEKYPSTAPSNCDGCTDITGDWCYTFTDTSSYPLSSWIPKLWNGLDDDGLVSYGSGGWNSRQLYLGGGDTHDLPYVRVSITLPDTFVITGVSMVSGQPSKNVSFDGDDSLFSGTTFFSEYSDVDGIACNRIDVATWHLDAIDTFQLTSITITGKGVNPFGSNNCE